MIDRPKVEGVAFDCYGTLIDYGDGRYAHAYSEICDAQGLPITGELLYEKWMDIWRRLVSYGQVGRATADVTPVPNSPGELSEAVAIPPHPQHHQSRWRPVDGPTPSFRTYREEWKEHFALCFEELGVEGDPEAAHEHLRWLLAEAPAFPEARRTVELISKRMPTALMSNADDDFLYPALERNALTFPIVLSSEGARAYKPHVSIFRRLSEEMGLPPENILYVGDSRLADVTGAKNAGMYAAWVNRQVGSTDAGVWTDGSGHVHLAPDYEIASLDELLELFDVE